VFEALYEPVFRYVRTLTDSRAAARDVTQDVFVRLWDAREELDPTQSLKAYVYRVARNRAYNRRRNRANRAAKEEGVRHDADMYAEGPSGPDLEAEAEQFEAHLRAWIADLPERQREALILSRYQGLSHDAIADVMDISPRTVNNHIVRALKRLRNHIDDYEPDLLNRDGS
jgi:RNA polymerase sigma-70 factor (ECF subfamily)